ncbi:MAG: hypothetical protein IPJ94_24540 [Chloroflexi bacterium]|nr:hypothetical protein [Chloroflexota bacterium]
MTAMLYWRVQPSPLATAVPGAVYEHLRRYYRAAKTSLHRQASYSGFAGVNGVGLRPILFKEGGAGSCGVSSASLSPP